MIGLSSMDTRDDNLTLIKTQSEDKIKSERIYINSINKIKTDKSYQNKIVDNLKFLNSSPKDNEENENENKIIRKDVFGNIIKKGSKKHKVTFIDLKGHKRGNLITDVRVESYKKYNEDISRKKYDEVNCQCSCMII